MNDLEQIQLYLQNNVAELTVLSEGVQLLEQKAVVVLVLVDEGLRAVLGV